jgi:hypothetical protein
MSENNHKQPVSLFDIAVELDNLRFMLDGDADCTTQEAADILRQIIVNLENIVGGWQKPAAGYRRDGVYMPDLFGEQDNQSAGDPKDIPF